jgi:hypothetical protein
MIATFLRFLIGLLQQKKNTMFVGRTKLNVLPAGMGGVESSIANLLSLLGMLYRLFHI